MTGILGRFLDKCTQHLVEDDRPPAAETAGPQVQPHSSPVLQSRWGALVTSFPHLLLVLWIWNDLFRVRLRIFRVPDPDPTQIPMLFKHIWKLFLKKL